MIPELQAHLQSYIDKVPTLQSASNPYEELNTENVNESSNIAMNNRQKQWFEVNVNVVKGLRGNRDDKEALLIQIKQNSKRLDGVQKEKNCSSIYLLSVDAQEATFYSKNVAQLPLCLTLGDSELNKHLFQGLKHRFDCTIYPLEIPEEELMWMSALWSSIPAELSNDETNAGDANDIPKDR